MNIGELWVAHPLFPRLMIILTAWVGFSTVVMIHNWVRIRRLERHNKLLQEARCEFPHIECIEEPATAAIEEAD